MDEKLFKTCRIKLHKVTKATYNLLLVINFKSLKSAYRQITKEVLSKFTWNFQETLNNLRSTFRILVVRNPWDRLLRLKNVMIPMFKTNLLVSVHTEIN